MGLQYILDISWKVACVIHYFIQKADVSIIINIFNRYIMLWIYWSAVFIYNTIKLKRVWYRIACDIFMYACTNH